MNNRKIKMLKHVALGSFLFGSFPGAIISSMASTENPDPSGRLAQWIEEKSDQTLERIKEKLDRREEELKQAQEKLNREREEFNQRREQIEQIQESLNQKRNCYSPEEFNRQQQKLDALRQEGNREEDLFNQQQELLKNGQIWVTNQRRLIFGDSSN